MPLHPPMGVMDSITEAVAWFEANPAMLRMGAILGIWVGTLIFVRYNARFFRRLDDHLEAMALTDRTHYHLDRMLDMFAVIVALFLTLAVAGVGGALWGALTALGVAGIIIGFAAKDLVANLFAGVTILFERPFMPGDSIQVGDEAGTVERVSLRSTTLKQFNGLQITLPNSTFITKPVTNFSVNPTRRVEARIEILHDSDAPRAMGLLREIGEAFPGRVEGEPVDAFIVQVREYALVMELRFWVPRTELRAALTHTYLEMTRRFQEAGIELAVPVRRTLAVEANGSVEASLAAAASSEAA